MNWTGDDTQQNGWRIASKADVLRVENRPLEAELEYQTTWDLLLRCEREFADLPALSFLLTGEVDEEPRTWTYSEFVGEVRRAANLISDLSTAPAAAVSLVLPNLPETHFLIWGAEAVGAANPINPFLEENYIANIMREAGSETAVTVAEHVSRDLFAKVRGAAEASGCVKRLVTVDLARYLGAAVSEGASTKVLPSGLEVISYEHVSGNYSPSVPNFERETGPDTIASLFHTGGTTGLPKLAKRSHLNEAYQGWVVSNFAGYKRQDTILCGLPLFHVNASIVTGLAAFVSGSHVLLTTPEGYRNRTFMANIWKIIERHNVTAISGVPTLYAALLDIPRGSADISSLKTGFCGAAPISPELFRKVEDALGLRIVEAYGLTEGGCVSTANPVFGEAKIGSVGIALPFQEVAVAELSADGEIADFHGTNEVGSVVVRGPNVFPGYTEERRNRGVLTGDGWLITGDLGKIDEDGFLWLTGRAKDLIIRGGHNIDPASIEDPLSAHPDVALAAAVGRPDSYAGELPVAFVQLRQGADADRETLGTWLRDQISEKAARPVRIDILDAMPLTTVGKTFKPTLRVKAVEQALSDHLAAHNINTAEYEVTINSNGQITATLSFGGKSPVSELCDEVSAWPIPVDIH
ncbi:acyl-CoA synthetase [Nitratireductor sp. XY-223]|uniref:acyl-CoA synthetase n=1 Tax=Nitratireductor sp. XY-223 TaxID=2561926 RepID=UPI0010A9E31C|nr:acyl-CoA synthetase [Nitratireductor sp. XY-223]